MTALCFKYLNVAVQINSGKVAHSPVVADSGISLIGLPKRRGHPLRSASKPCVRLVASHGSSSMRSVVTDTFRFVFGMPLVVAVAMKSTFVAEFFIATFTFWGEMID